MEEKELKDLSPFKKYLKLYTVFFQLGAMTFGGGYAMLALLQQVVVDQYHWCTEEELADYYAIGQCTPGIIALNTSTFVGYKKAGVLGGILTSLGFLSPSIILISIIAAFLKNFAEIAFIRHAFGGIRICVCALILDAVLKLGKKSVVDPFSIAVFVIILVLAAFTEISTAILVISAGLVGLAVYWAKKMSGKAGAGK